MRNLILEGDGVTFSLEISEEIFYPNIQLGGKKIFFAGLVQSIEYTEYRKQDTKYSVKSTVYRVQSTEYIVYRVQNTEYRVQSTEYRVQSIQYKEYRIQSTEYKVVT